MKIFTDPEVYLIAHPTINWSGVHSFFGSMDNFGEEFPCEAWTDDGNSTLDRISTEADLLGEFAGRMCYGSFGGKQGRKTNKSYMEHIIGMGHGSILEHANFTFLVTQASRGYTHEMVRHRAGFAYSQESTHYVDYSVEKARVCVDVNTVCVHDMANLFENTLEESFASYEHAYKEFRKAFPKKVACSMARQLLPIAIEAKLVFTGNIRALRHFMTARGNEHNVMEIRKVALKVYGLLKNMAPNSLWGLEVVPSKDGFRHIEAINTGAAKV